MMDLIRFLPRERAGNATVSALVEAASYDGRRRISITKEPEEILSAIALVGEDIDRRRRADFPNGRGQVIVFKVGWRRTGSKVMRTLYSGLDGPESLGDDMP
jgi:hypothetical protein